MKGGSWRDLTAGMQTLFQWELPESSSHECEHFAPVLSQPLPEYLH